MVTRQPEAKLCDRLGGKVFAAASVPLIAMSLSYRNSRYRRNQEDRFGPGGELMATIRGEWLHDALAVYVVRSSPDVDSACVFVKASREQF